MLAVAFDTLKLARKLENAGMAAKQAQDTSAALAENSTEWHSVGNLSTKDDVEQAKTALHEDIQQLKIDLATTKAEILKWLFGAIGAQTLVLLGTLFGLLHSVVRF